MLKGILHIHSTYSDGEFTLAELRERLVADGCRFACVTDHAEWFDAAQLDDYRRACEQLSDDAFRFVPGLEYGCADRMHILGYGVTTPAGSIDPEQVITHIVREGGLAVIAHPRDEAFAAIERFSPLPDGIEVWNSKYDGRYAPRNGTFALLERVRQRRPDVKAFYGQDLHWRRQYRGLFTMAGCDVPSLDAVLGALRRGDYIGVKGSLQLPSSGRLSTDLVARFDRAHAHSRRFRQWVRVTKRWADRAGVAVPAVVKAHVRRLF